MEQSFIFPHNPLYIFNTEIGYRPSGDIVIPITATTIGKNYRLLHNGSSVSLLHLHIPLNKSKKVKHTQKVLDYSKKMSKIPALVANYDEFSISFLTHYQIEFTNFPKHKVKCSSQITIPKLITYKGSVDIQKHIVDKWY